MKFIADIMVGKLAKYLRMAGYDVLYDNNISDEEILNTAKNAGRIVLTRDSIMLRRRECRQNIIKSMLIRDDKLTKQLQQVKEDLKIELKPNLVRCLECNSILLSIKKEEVENKVPPYVFKTQNTFLFCPKCSKYYWRGTHFESISKAFKTINSQ